jgi:hypothetical protein
MPGSIALSSFPITRDPNAQAIHANSTVTASGSSIVTGYGSSEVTLFVNVKAAPTGTTPTLTYTLQEVDPGDTTTVIGTTVSSTTISALGIQKVTLPCLFGGAIKVSWTVTGTTPSFTQVYATLINKSGTIKITDAAGTAFGTSTNPIQVSEFEKATYSASILALAPATTPTDVFTITGSASKVLRVTYLEVFGIQTTAGHPVIQLVKRSTANTGGTSAAVTAVPYDSSDAAATGTVLSYTANPTALGTSVGVVRAGRIFVPTSATASDQHGVRWDFGTRDNGKAVVLRGTTQVLAVNLNSVTLTGGSLSINVEWTEE